MSSIKLATLLNPVLKSKVFEIGQLIIYQKFQTGPILTVELGNSVILGKVCKINTLDDSLIELSNFTFNKQFVNSS